MIAPNKSWALHHGDCLEVMRRMPANSVDGIVTDPPYGLSAEPDMVEVLQHWLNGDHYEHGSKGFMGRDWDSFVPGPEYWREAYRVLKPGGHLIAFTSTRTSDILGISLRLAGFENRGHLAWLFGTGWPKSMSVAKAIDKELGFQGEVVGKEPIRGGINGGNYVTRTERKDALRDVRTLSEQAAKYRGYGTALKPAFEPILMMRKPIEGTIAQNVMKWGTGGLNIDGCRVGFISPGDEKETKHKNRHADFGSGARNNAVYGKDARTRASAGNYNAPGRWPPNLLLVHAEGCRRVGIKTVSTNTHYSVSKITGYGRHLAPGVGSYSYDGPGDQPKTEKTEAWECEKRCPVKEIDGQSGIRASGAPHEAVKSEQMKERSRSKGWGSISDLDTTIGYGDEGTASRFLPQFPFRYVVKPTDGEKDAGCEGLPVVYAEPPEESTDEEGKKRKIRQQNLLGEPVLEGLRNPHQTVKPIDLARWLTRLITPAGGGIILDPFAGSGSLGCAAVLEGVYWIGIEQEEQYVKVAEARLAYWERVAREAVSTAIASERAQKGQSSLPVT